MKDDQILTILVETQYITEDDRKDALKKTDNDPGLALDSLIQQQILTDDIVGQAIAEHLKVEYYDLNTFVPPKEQVVRIPEQAAKDLRLIFFKELDDIVQVSSDNPTVLAGNANLIIKKEEKAGILGGTKEVTQERSLKLELEKILEKPVTFGYSLSKDIDKVLGSYKASLSARFIKIMDKLDQVAPEIVDEIIAEAVQEKVSDIHFEPQPTKQVRVRFRIDGMLQEVGRIPLPYYENVLNLIKVQAQLRTDEHFIPQDGAIRFEQNGTSSDVRVSIIPTVSGEKIVLRVLSSTVNSLDLDTLGFNERNVKLIRKAAQQPFGMILVTGPTGSGKSTTLYALLKTINDEGRNITTIEDPVEYKIDGVNHIQVNRATDLTFAKGLRSILRQDPDVVLVGEIRDDETAQISVNAALTGHLLFSTIHANDGEGTLPRLLNMDVDPFLVSSTLELVVAQRLVRRICDACKYTYKVKRKDLEKQIDEDLERFFPEEEITMFKGKGCSNCGFSGYKGRTAIFQLIEMTQEIRDAMLENPTSDQIREISRKQGAVSMFEDGVEKVRGGTTTFDEVLRVAAVPEE